MKQCPRCNFVYADDTLEFCLEDGSRLVSEPPGKTAAPTIFATKGSNPTTEKTVSFPFSNQAETVEFQKAGNLQNNARNTVEAQPNGKGITEKSFKIIETSSIAAALLHNWWQWLYLNNQYYSTFTAYVLSANFLMWLLLLAIGITIGLYALKRARNKIVPIIGLVVLAVNLILFLVPKR